MDHCDQSKYFKAILAINKSLCHESSCLASAYVARSKIFWELKEYQACLDSINLARQHSATKSLKGLEMKCRKELISKKTDDDDPWNFFKLSYPANPKIPFIADCLEVRESWKFGRGVITTKPLRPGDVVAIEEPLFRMLNLESRYSRCANCMSCNKMNLIPCPGKCTTSMFCSHACLASATENYHQFECDAQSQPLEGDNEYDSMVLRIVFESLNFCGGIKKLQDFVASLKPNSSIFDFDVARDRTLSLLKAVFSLRQGPTSDEDACMAEWIVDNHPKLIASCKTKFQKEFMKKFIVKIMGIMDRNSYIFYCPSFENPNSDIEIGNGVFPFASLINHSCSPNLYRIFVDNKQAFVVKRPIDAGQQLFVGYQYVQ